jgi:hypothetical protein
MWYTEKLHIQTCTFTQIPSIVQDMQKAVLYTVMHCTDAVMIIALMKKQST